MKISSIASLLIIPFTTFGQNTDTLKAKRVAIGFSFSPDYSYHTFRPGAVPTLLVYPFGIIEYIPKLGFTTGVNFAFVISKKITLETGVLYSGKGYKTKEIDLTHLYPPGQFDPTAPIKIQFISHFHYIDIPLKVNYYLFTQKLKFYITAGIFPSIFLSRTATSPMTYTDGHIVTPKATSSTDYRRIHLAALAGCGFNFSLATNSHLKIEPLFRRSITSIIDSRTKSYLCSPGLNLGVYYRL